MADNRPANQHVTRVTLHLLKLSTMTPAPIEGVLEDLARTGWSLDHLPQEAVERIYAHVDRNLIDQMIQEWDADSSQIVDNGVANSVCKLCGHPHIRWEFLLRNRFSGNTVWTGSDCIIRYHVTVDGEAVEAVAAARLRRAITSAAWRTYANEWQRNAKNASAIHQVGEWLTEMFTMGGVVFSSLSNRQATSLKRMYRFYRLRGALTKYSTDRLLNHYLDLVRTDLGVGEVG